MKRCLPQTVWFLVIVLVAQLLTVAAGNTHLASRLNPVAEQSAHHAMMMKMDMDMEHGNGCVSMEVDRDSTGQSGSSCDEQDDCHLQHCSAVPALAKAFPAMLFPDLDRSWPRFSARPLLMPLPPLGQPPKAA
ncbi:hypothetical protein [Marinobacterium lacunae]|nr:hypothetical protein [Marinobacterium lacunae]